MHWAETLQVNETFEEFKLPFMEMMKKYNLKGDFHLGRIAVAKHRIVLRPLDTHPVHSSPLRAGLKQRKLEHEDIDDMPEIFMAEPAVKK